MRYGRAEWTQDAGSVVREARAPKARQPLADNRVHGVHNRALPLEEGVEEQAVFLRRTRLLTVLRAVRKLDGPLLRHRPARHMAVAPIPVHERHRVERMRRLHGGVAVVRYRTRAGEDLLHFVRILEHVVGYVAGAQLMVIDIHDPPVAFRDAVDEQLAPVDALVQIWFQKVEPPWRQTEKGAKVNVLPLLLAGEVNYAIGAIRCFYP